MDRRWPAARGRVCLLGACAWGLMLLCAATAAAESPSIFDPASPSTHEIERLWVLVVAITGGILLLVEGVLLYSLFRFRRRKQDLDEPPQVYGSMPIEIAWTAAPALVVFVLLLVVIRTVYAVRVDHDLPPEGAQPLYVTVVGHQWWWEYVYETYDGRPLGFTTANELYVPASEEGVPRPVYLTLKSADVCHSFWVPQLAGKTDLIPGRANQMWFQSSQSQLYVGQCAEYCGTQHAKMLLRVVVQPPDEFERWLAGQQQPAAEVASVSAGREIFFAHGCVNCHTVRGTTAVGTFGPDLTHLMSRATLASGIIENTPENLNAWITNPQAIKPGCTMPAFGLSTAEFAALTDYLTTLH